ncbi:MAG: YncE family protein [Parafilimonas sp.]|nr:YncE family protein [Parafilimonas sp.]
MYLFRNITLVFLLSIIAQYISAQDSIYTFYKSIPIPGNGSYDYISMDEVNRHLFVSHGTVLDIIDLNTEQVIDSVTGMKGIHGVAVVNDVNKGFISDGKGKAVIVFNLKTFKTIAIIPLSKEDADGIMYDPFSKNVFVFCGDANAACVIDVNKLKEIATIDLGGAPEFAVPDGNGLIYDNLEDKSSLAVIDSKSFKVIKTFPLAPCEGPTGLALDLDNKRAFTVCRGNKGMSVVDINTGKIIATLPIGAGVDAVKYDDDNKLIFCSNGDGTATVIKQNSADDYEVMQTLTTTYKAKTMAFDKQTGNIYFSAAKFDDNKKILPNTFAVMVYKRNK